MRVPLGSTGSGSDGRRDRASAPWRGAQSHRPAWDCRPHLLIPREPVLQTPSLDPTASLRPLVPHPTRLPLLPATTCDLPCLLPTAPPLTNILAETQSHRPRFFWPCPQATAAICFPPALLEPVINQDMLPQENIVIGDATRAQRGRLTCSLTPHAPPCSTRPLSPPLPPSLR